MASPDSSSLAKLVQTGRYLEVLTSGPGKEFIRLWVAELQAPATSSTQAKHGADTLAVATAALRLFLQINVTGPVPDANALRGWEDVLAAVSISSASSASDAAASVADAGAGDRPFTAVRRAVLRSLGVDGVAVYSYAPSIELFGFARWLIFGYAARTSEEPARKEGVQQAEQPQKDEADNSDDDALLDLGDARDGGMRCNVAWARLRLLVWHYRLLVQPSLSGGSIFNKAAQWSDVPSLQTQIEQALDLVETEVLGASEGKTRWTVQERVLFLLEKATICVMLGRETTAREALRLAAERHGFVYALSGALGKRTRFQEKSTSQLVVLAKSGMPEGDGGESRPQTKPQALLLNDDTLLESLEFSSVEKERAKTDDDAPEDTKALKPPALRDLVPDDQPQLSPLDQVILLTEATLLDAFTPADDLTAEEMLPFAARVISDKSANWQIYTQALVVRSRIEVHRSRTVERGVLQMQAVVDQIVVDTSARSNADTEQVPNDEPTDASNVPIIEITAPREAASARDRNTQTPAKPGSMFPAAAASDSSPAEDRLRFVDALSCPPRWHLESELAFAWAGIGSLVSALEIFQRLRLWAEVALCLAASGAANDEDGRRSSGEEKARAIVRWRLFHRNNEQDTVEDDDQQEQVDISALKVSDFTGPKRNPPPPNAARLCCILGDLENDPAHYEEAWAVSQHRYARAQKSLGEYYLQQKDWLRARDAYRQAVAINRLSSELWNRLGDISLRLGAFADAGEAFGRAVAAASDATGGEDARTWSNLGSALWSLYIEAVEARKKERQQNGEGEDYSTAEEGKALQANDDGSGDSGATPPEHSTDAASLTKTTRDPAALLAQALAAYKRGAALARDNWRIWDNVLTLASRMRPPAVADMVQALRSIIALRHSEDALDVAVLRRLLNEAVLSQPKPDDHDGGEGKGSTAAVYDPPRGTAARAVCELLETEVAPLITARSELWELLVRERVWRRDYAGAVDAAERAWRAAMSSSSSGGTSAARNWLEDKDEWEVVVDRTDELVSVLENYGPEAPGIGPKWKGRARAAVRSVMSKARDAWEASAGWERLASLLNGLT